ncbi:hypothetical protein GQ44DRAFT_820072 [Phaeosphaeriaceae sp. PMI808]|nr:hypothetical protein GQ44DRAFT_820072 [Phaeosphaeriaceae sp. PMI808]
MGGNPEEDAVSTWYKSIFSRRVDLIGDYAGSELFFVEFDSLLLQCFSNPKLNFSTGFQLLHAVYIVEKLLQDLLSRNCRFQIVCFDQNEDLCIPTNSQLTDYPKYVLARSVIFRHLTRNLNSGNIIVIKRFDSFTDADFGKYLKESGAYFVMCHDGATPNNWATSSCATSVRRVKLRSMISWFVTNQCSVALMNELTCSGSGVMTVILESSRHKIQKDFSIYGTVISQNEPTIETPAWEKMEGIIEPSERDVFSILVLHTAMQDGVIIAEEASTFLLHTTALQYLHFKTGSLQSLHKTLSRTLLLLSHEQLLAYSAATNLPSNLADLIDGFLLTSLIRDVSLRNTLLANLAVLEKYETLVGALVQISSGSFDRKFILKATADYEDSEDLSRCCYATPRDDRTVLSFKNAIFDKHLAPVYLHLDVRLSNNPNPENIKVFQEISHWHNHRNAMAMKGPTKKLGLFARRRNDWFMAEMHAYAASLTNTAGKVLNPETIIVNQRVQPLKKQRAYAVGKTDITHQLKTEVCSKSSNKIRNPTRKSGKAVALESAAAIKAAKAKSKEDVDAAFWKAKCNELLFQPDMKIRYTSARDYSIKLYQSNQITPEVELYMVDCLLRIWIVHRESKKEDAGASLVALVWDALLRLSKMDSGVTPEIVASQKMITKLLGFPTLDCQANAASRPLGFTGIFTKAKILKDPIAASIDRTQLYIPGGAKTFQLEHCGPYLERAIDSAPDSRVPFHPDAWQRKVLDAIDDNHSLFVVAPTSAGKTFISFYAMKQVLTNDDDGVVVYVAPTKALVNQIAAEVQARFSKSFKLPGKSVWAIHTRDYRINSATGCQILVTVPHILQIMLLAPSNAEKKNSWSCRIKRIIFDEVHCIGQAEDGVVWEQLLLQSPCPIIALSATVGNPKEFSSWLASTQEANGNKLITIEHHHRHSDLRKFIYIPPKRFCFSGLPRSCLIYTPGLDRTDAFNFIHPVASLSNKSRGMPKDLHLEARDCLWLWQTMKKHATENYIVPPNLSPHRALPDIIKKIHIFEWEKALKAKLLEWMNTESSPFEKVQQELSKAIVKPAARDILTTNHNCDDMCNAREVHSQSLSSIILPALADLHAKNALPAIVFNYDRGQCEKLMRDVVKELETNEEAWKDSNISWKKKLIEFENTVKKKAKRGGDDEGNEVDEEKGSRLDREREAGMAEHSKWDGFDPHAPINGFHFANAKKLLQSELDDYKQQLRQRGIAEWLISALNRGIGVHHAGMNRKYRQVVEILFRKSYLQVVIATGTLALGINMPCKTVVFAGDSIFLTALNFRQCAGRAGRRGFDVLGNVLFLGIPVERVFRLLSSRLPDLNGHFPITTSLVLRLATLLHGSNNSEFAIQTINSIFSQPRLYLGSPKSKMAVLHHLRFSIEYLRRQSLLDFDGSPINFAGCVSHLYYTENSAWAFHVLLSSGYFHELCWDIDANPKRVCLTLMLVLSHIFGRHQCKGADEEFVEDVVKRSSSIVFLPPLPKEAEQALRAHNTETLAIFSTYVQTFADQHLKDPDDTLPLSKMRIGSEEQFNLPLGANPQHTAIRSPFVALSGHADDFDSISDLCNTVRSGVFLEEAVVPYLPIHPEYTAPLNAYLYDFYKHGDVNALERANKIRKSDVWFHLNDFSLVLATITTSLTNFMKPSSTSETNMADLMGCGDGHEELEDDKVIVERGDKTGQRSDDLSPSNVWAPLGVWDDESDENDENDEMQGWNDVNDKDMRLPKVLKAFQCLREVFDENFKQMWA